MSLTARLHIEGHQNENKGIRVLACNFKFSQTTDQRGLPTSKIEGGKINVSIAVENDVELLHWMFTEAADKNGKIIFVGMDNGKSLKTIEFWNGRLIKYFESFKDCSKVFVQITISAKKISVAGASHENVWSGYD
ncbi:MAG: hypothetical protein HQ522_02955 [Bacteroidetes bacterium]|nr:hypothetical protein [Bacteroidota bacterium]